jgi:hypothetical protein
MWAFLVMLVIVAWAQVAAMFVGIGGLRRLIWHPTMGSAPVAPLTAGPPDTPRVERPVPPDWVVTAGEPPIHERQVDPPKRHQLRKGASAKGGYYVAGGI